MRFVSFFNFILCVPSRLGAQLVFPPTAPCRSGLLLGRGEKQGFESTALEMSPRSILFCVAVDR